MINGLSNTLITELRANYATTTRKSNSECNGDDKWPRGSSGCEPTPYQILGHSEHAPYNKARFFELVKIYHPDTKCDDIHAANQDRHILPQAIRLERYRLIVAANVILSDPVKRRAYDRFGAGWETHRNDKSSRVQNGMRPGPFSTSWADQQRQSGPNIWANATWEDWERWRECHDNDGNNRQSLQHPVYVRNSAFASLIVAAVLISSSWTLTKAEAEGERFLAARDAVHDQSSKDLNRVKQFTQDRAKDERIEWFVRNRQAIQYGTGVEEIREEKIHRLLPPPETCSSEDRSSRN